MQHDDLVKFLKELPIAIALLLSTTAYLVAISAPYARNNSAEYVINIALAE